jgi:DNA polymerase-3 subunit epsilon
VSGARLGRLRAGLRGRPYTEVELAALDFETTGLDAGRDHVISFGVVPVRAGRIVLGETVHERVRPPVAPSATSVTIHGMRSQDLADAASLEQARPVLAAALDSRPILAWYAPMEIAFLAQVFGGRRRIARSVIDVRLLAIEHERRVRDARRPGTATTGEDPGSGALTAGETPVERMSLSAYAEKLQVPVADPHDALDDAMVTAHVFLVLATKLRRRDSALSVGELLRLGRT